MAQWSLLPNSVLPPELSQNLPGGGLSDPKSSMLEAWTESTYDMARDRVSLVRVGGHADGAHNGVRVYDHVTQQWILLKADSLAYTTIGSNNTGKIYATTYADGSPASVHTYDSQVYMPPPFDKVLTPGGIFWSPGGESTPSTSFTFSFVTNLYQTVAPRFGGYGCLSCWDPVTQRVLYRTTGGFYAYDPSTDTHTQLFSGAPPNGLLLMSSPLVIDSVNRKVYYSQQKNAAPFGLRVIDLNNLALKDSPLLATAGVTAIENTAGLGLVFQSSSQMIAYGANAGNTGGTLYTLDLTQNPAVWTRLDTSGGANPPLPHINGTWKKFYRRNNGRICLLTKTGIFEITPDTADVPPVTTKKVRIAADLNITYAPSAAPPPPPPPDPPGGSNPIPVNTWTLVPALPGGTPLTVREGKHQRMQFYSPEGRFYITGGDRRGSDAGQPIVDWFDPRTGLTQIISPQCIPVPDLMPNYPDNVGWVLDTTRNKFLLFRGFFFKSRVDMTTSGITLTPAATSGNGVTVTASAPIFKPYMATCARTDSDPTLGLLIQQTSVAGGQGTVVASCAIKSITSPTQAVVDITVNFADTNPIASNMWVIRAAHAGKASQICGRNRLDGDTGILDDAMFDPVTRKWERPTWPPNPLGSSDATGPTWAAYDEVSDAVYLVKNRTTLLILHRATDTWETIPFGQSMATGDPQRAFVQGANCYRAQLVVADGYLYMVCANDTDGRGLIRFKISDRTWAGFPLPGGYTNVPDDTEPALVYDPVSNVLLHPRCETLTGVVPTLYIFDIATSTWSSRAVPDPAVGSEQVRLGCADWDPTTSSMIFFGRLAQGVPGFVCWHYRYAP